MSRRPARGHHGSSNASSKRSPAPARAREDDDLFDDDGEGALAAALTGSGFGGAGLAGVLDPNSALNSKVLVLNRMYAAIRVVSARRAFCLLMRDIAEVIHVESVAAREVDIAEPGVEIETASGSKFINYDFATWADMAALQSELERDRHDWVRTPRFEIAVPRIIRLLGYDRLPDQTVKLNRRNLFARDRNTCQYCGRHYSTHDLSIDHVKPRAQGGGDTWENLVCACIRCNARKGGRTPDQASMKLVKKPERPKRNPVISLRLGNEKYRSWKTFLDHAYWDVELR